MNNTEPQPQPQKFECWALVELMGHQRIVGKCTEQTIAGGAMLRVDVPNPDGNTRFTRFYGTAAIYAIHPMVKEEAILYAQQMDTEPAFAYSVRQLMAPKEDEDEKDAERIRMMNDPDD